MIDLSPGSAQFTKEKQSSAVLCLDQDFYLNFKGIFASSKGNTKIYLYFTCQLEYTFRSFFLLFLFDFELDVDRSSRRMCEHDNDSTCNSAIAMVFALPIIFSVFFFFYIFISLLHKVCNHLC